MCGLNAEDYKKLKDSTGLNEEELEDRYQVFFLFLVCYKRINS